MKVKLEMIFKKPQNTIGSSASDEYEEYEVVEEVLADTSQGVSDSQVEKENAEAEVVESGVEEQEEFLPSFENEVKEIVGEDGQTKKVVKKKRKVKTRFFDSKELIDCIAQNSSHTNGDGPSAKYFQTITDAIETKLAEFKVDGKIINILNFTK